MARTAIHHEKTRSEMIEKIWDIFLRNGYERTTLSRIIEELGISKGAFYHYFPTKEACADAAVGMYARRCRDKVAPAVAQDLTARENFRNLVAACARLTQENVATMETINTPVDAAFHLRLMAAFVRELAPLYAQVIDQGNREGALNCEHPLEMAQMMLTLTNFYFDGDLFGWDPQEIPGKLSAFEQFLAFGLRAQSGFFDFLHDF